MKLKYKKMVIIATVVAMALGFVALIFLDNDGPTNNAEDASLNLNQNKDINQLIEPITPSNTVNSINIYKVDYSDLWSASASYLPNVFINPRKIKGKKLNDNAIKTNPKIGQLKIKQFVSPILKSYWGLVSKAVKIKNTISLNTDNDKYMFVMQSIQNAI